MFNLENSFVLTICSIQECMIIPRCQIFCQMESFLSIIQVSSLSIVAASLIMSLVFIIVVKSIVSPRCRRVISSVIWRLVASCRLVHNILRFHLIALDLEPENTDNFVEFFLVALGFFFPPLSISSRRYLSTIDEENIMIYLALKNVFSMYDKYMSFYISF